MNRQATLLVKELKVGTIYRDVLSGYLVLVRHVDVQHAPEPVASGLIWNPVSGAHNPITVYDHMLIAAENKTALKPDTRYEDGYYGQ